MGGSALRMSLVVPIGEPSGFQCITRPISHLPHLQTRLNETPGPGTLLSPLPHTCLPPRIVRNRHALRTVSGSQNAEDQRTTRAPGLRRNRGRQTCQALALWPGRCLAWAGLQSLSRQLLVLLATSWDGAMDPPFRPPRLPSAFATCSSTDTSRGCLSLSLCLCVWISSRLCSIPVMSLVVPFPTRL